MIKFKRDEEKQKIKEKKITCFENDLLPEILRALLSMSLNKYIRFFTLIQLEVEI